MLAGGTLSWFVLMPMIALFGADATVFPGTEAISLSHLVHYGVLTSNISVPEPLQPVVSLV